MARSWTQNLYARQYATLFATWLLESATTEFVLVETWWQMLKFAHTRYISERLGKSHL